MVLDSVKLAFEDFFGAAYVNQFQASIFPVGEIPCVFREQHTIFLSAKGRRWAQFVYQFAHELCHVMVGPDIPARMRWFEEAICELASIFFIRRLSERWRLCPPYPNWGEYSDSLRAYSDNILEEAAVFAHGKVFWRYFRDHLEYLEGDPYQREINRFCAVNLLPVFEAAPEIWKDVALLGKIPAQAAFTESLKAWVELSSRTVDARKILALFAGPDSFAP